MSEADQAAALEAVADLVQRIDAGAMLQRFVLVAEVIDADSVRATWCLVPPGATVPDTLGLLAYADLVERAAWADRE